MWPRPFCWLTCTFRVKRQAQRSNTFLAVQTMRNPVTLSWNALRVFIGKVWKMGCADGSRNTYHAMPEGKRTETRGVGHALSVGSRWGINVTLINRSRFFFFFFENIYRSRWSAIKIHHFWKYRWAIVWGLFWICHYKRKICLVKSWYTWAHLLTQNYRVWMRVLIDRLLNWSRPNSDSNLNTTRKLTPENAHSRKWWSFRI